MSREGYIIPYHRFNYFHAGQGNNMQAYINYLISYAAPVKNFIKPEASLIMVDSGLLSGAKKEGIAFTRKQNDVIKYAESINADRVVMMDIPMFPDILKALEVTVDQAWNIHFENTRLFAINPTKIRKVFVIQGPYTYLYDYCCQNMKDSITENDIIAIGGLKNRSTNINEIIAILEIVTTYFPFNEIHLLGVGALETLAAVVPRFNITQSDSTTASQYTNLYKYISLPSKNNLTSYSLHTFLDLELKSDTRTRRLMAHYNQILWETAIWSKVQKAIEVKNELF